MSKKGLDKLETAREIWGRAKELYLPTKLMNTQEIEAFKETVRRNWETDAVPRLKSSLEVNARLLQQVTIRQEVIKEMIHELESGKRQPKPSSRRDM